jgi:hypothetical protein
MKGDFMSLVDEKFGCRLADAIGGAGNENANHFHRGRDVRGLDRMKLTEQNWQLFFHLSITLLT